MLKFSAALLMTIFSFGSAEAEENLLSAEVKPVEIVRPSLPECNDAKLQRLLDEKVSEYYRKTPPESLLEKRMQQLILRNFHSFEPVDTSSFGPEDDLRVANKLISVKINNGLNDDEVRLCRTQSDSKLPIVYLLIYPENFAYMVEVINFIKYSPSHKDFFVIYD